MNARSLRASFVGLTLLVSVAGLSAQTPEALAKKHGCFECHAAGETKVGPAFRAIAAKYSVDLKDFRLQFLSVAAAGDLPQQRSTIFLAKMNGGLHVRIVDALGRRLVDKSEASLLEGADLIELRKKWSADPALAEAKLAPAERRLLLEKLVPMVAGNGAHARHALIATIQHGGREKWRDVTGGARMPPFSNSLTAAEIGSLADWVLRPNAVASLKILTMGLGAGTVASSHPGVDSFAAPTMVALTAQPDNESIFVKWEGDAKGSANPLKVLVDKETSIRAVFELRVKLAALMEENLPPDELKKYLEANPRVNSPERFLSVLPRDFKQNWILMTRSESLQTGTAAHPRILLPSENGKFVFSIGPVQHPSFPGSHPDAIEYMQWDKDEKNFRFHEVVLKRIDKMDAFPERLRGITIDDAKCFRCHSTQNVLNRSPNKDPGTTGVVPGTIKYKSRPNWDTYDSWAGMLPFNRDRIFQGSVEAAAFRRILNPWTWKDNDSIRKVVEQLELQPPSRDAFEIKKKDIILRCEGGKHDGHIQFSFDNGAHVYVEPDPIGGMPGVETAYEFKGVLGTGTKTPVKRDGLPKEEHFVTLHHSLDPSSDEGRGVRLFDLLGGLAGTDFNQTRVADEMIAHRPEVGGKELDVRPIALAITERLVLRSGDKVVSAPGKPTLDVDLTFFEKRFGMKIDKLSQDTADRTRALPRRKADLQKLNLDRTGDQYLIEPEKEKGLLLQYGSGIKPSPDALEKLRQEVFRRHVDVDPDDFDRTGVLGHVDASGYKGIYVDRENYDPNTEFLTLYRYFLEPLGVSVDRWSMGVRGRSRTYSFADVFGTYLGAFRKDLRESIENDNRSTGLTKGFTDDQLIDAVNRSLAKLPLPDEIPSFLDVQRIFNKACVECHGGLNYPPYHNSKHLGGLDLSEDEEPPMGKKRLDRSHRWAVDLADYIYERITDGNEDCPYGIMPCGGPTLSKVDVETFRRWKEGGTPSSSGSFQIETVNDVQYEFRGAGEFILLRGQDMELQARLQPVVAANVQALPGFDRRLSGTSVNSAVAVRFGNDRITYQPSATDPKVLELRVNGELKSIGEQPLPLADGGRILRTIAPNGIQIESAGGTTIIVTPTYWEQQKLWHMILDTRRVRALEGLMGAVPPGNWLPALPGFKFLGARPIDPERGVDDLYNKLGKSWRVEQAASLFDYAKGASAKTFAFDTWPLQPLPIRADVPGIDALVQPLSLETAQRLSAGILDPLEFRKATRDVMVTGDSSFAKGYLWADRIRRNRAPTAPVLVAPKNFQVGLEPRVTFSWKASTDEDGDPLTYRHLLWPVNRLPNANEAVAVEARPEAETIYRRDATLERGKAYFWKVIVEDGKGGSAVSRTYRLEVGK